MGEAEQRLLVATDCLSEGINLQSLFDTVIHYDLSWNPTRHQQREGRVDRFGQPAELVRSVLLYSPDSAIDGAVLEVILRKAERIRKATGVTVPLPDERGAVTGALMNAVLLRKGRARQLSLRLRLAADAQAMETRWRDAEEGERRSRARFAQNAIKPEEVIPEWQRWRELLGSPDQVRRFVERAMSRLDAPLEPEKAAPCAAHLDALPAALASGSQRGDWKARCVSPSRSRRPPGAEMVAPQPSAAGDACGNAARRRARSGSSPVPSLGRAGAWPTPAVKTVTTVALLRLRYKLTVHGRRERMLLARKPARSPGMPAHDRLTAEGEAARALLEAAGERRPCAFGSRQRADAKRSRSDRRQCSAWVDRRAMPGSARRHSPRIMPACALPASGSVAGQRRAGAAGRRHRPLTFSFRQGTEAWPRTRTGRTALALRCHHRRGRADRAGHAGAHRLSSRPEDRPRPTTQFPRALRCATRSRAISASARRCSPI